VRPEHKAYLGAVADRIAFAGPLLDDDGATMLGSLLAVDFPSHAAALAAYASHPEHLRAKAAAGDLRIDRHQVDYVVDAAPNAEAQPAQRLGSGLA